MGYSLLIGLTIIVFFLFGPPLIMAYAALNERRQQRIRAAGEAAVSTTPAEPNGGGA